MKKFIIPLILLSLINLPAGFAQGEALGHGGGNGGDDFELELKKRSLQIGYFLKSSVGAQTFKSLNADAVIEAINSTDIDVVSGNVTDKYGTLRTCVNEPDRSLITCNLNRLVELKKKNQQDILTAMLFHEILGIMGLELGHQENVSLYPVSSKIIPYHSIVESTPITEGEIRPEYYGLDNSSYGITVTNKRNKESLRMICLNDNVEVHRCRNYSVVRSANSRQAPLIPEVVTLTPSDLLLLKNNFSIAVGYSRSTTSDLGRHTWDHVFQILNFGNDLSLIGRKVEIKEKLYNSILEDLTKVVSEKINHVIRAKKAEQDARIAAQKAEEAKRAAWQNRKDQDPMKNIGDFSITLTRDLILLAKTQSQVLSHGNQKQIECNLNYTQSSFDRVITSKSAIKSINVEESPSNEFSIKLNFQYGNIPFEIKCAAYRDLKTLKPYVPTIRVIKDSLASFMTITLDDPVQVQ